MKTLTVFGMLRPRRRCFDAQARFLLGTAGLSKRRVGEYLGASGEFNQQVLREQVGSEP